MWIRNTACKSLLPFVRSEKGPVLVHRFRASSSKMVRVGVVGYGHLGQYLADKILKDGEDSGMCFICGLQRADLRFVLLCRLDREDMCFICGLRGEDLRFVLHLSVRLGRCASSVDYEGKI
jgi:hypothetical protein